MTQDFAYPDGCKVGLGDLLENIRAGSSRKGWVGKVVEIKTGARSQSFEPYITVRLFYDRAEHHWLEQSYQLRYFHSNLKKIKEKVMGSTEGKYIVWCPTKGNPSVRHSAHHIAEAEAKRLASLNPGHEFYVAVLKTVSSVSSVTTRSVL